MLMSKVWNILLYPVSELRQAVVVARAVVETVELHHSAVYAKNVLGRRWLMY